MGSSRQNEGRYGAGSEADSRAVDGGSGLISFLFLSFPFCCGLLFSLAFAFVSGDEGYRGGGAPPSSQLARRGRGYGVLSYSNSSAYSMNKTKQTSSLLPLLFPHLCWVVGHVSLVLLVQSWKCAGHACSSCRAFCLNIPRALGENRMNFMSNMSATQPIGIFLPPPSRKSTQLYGFTVLPPSCNYTSLC